MITKQPTIEDIYKFDSFINTPGVRQGLLERAGDGDPELTIEDTDDGQAVYYNTPHGEIFPVGRPIQLAMGGNASGRASDRPMSDIPMALMDMGAGVARGAVAQTLGLGGDLQSLYNGLKSVFNRPEDQDRIDAFLSGLKQPTALPTTERMGEILPPVVPAGAPDAKMRQGSANYGQTFGELAPLPNAIDAGVAGLKALPKAVKALAPTAAEMVINAAEKTGMPVRGISIVENGNLRYAPTTGAADDNSMRDLLSAKGKSVSIGDETGRTVANGVSKFKSKFGSTRYVYSEDGEPKSVLQIVSQDGSNGLIANVYTVPEDRQKGIASSLFAQAKKDFASIEHSTNLSPDGAAFANSVERVDNAGEAKTSATMQDKEQK